MSEQATPQPVQWSGKTSSYNHKWNDTPNPPDTKKGFRKVWFLDAQWSTCPIEVERQVREMWSDYDCGNDRYVIKTDLATLRDSYPVVAQYVAEQQPDIGEEELILVHWWW